jgi:hypothetical protein
VKGVIAKGGATGSSAIKADAGTAKVIKVRSKTNFFNAHIF